jgi:Aminoglycoside-2''-adenylyltransferase
MSGAQCLWGLRLGQHNGRVSRDSQEALLLRTLGWLDRVLVEHHLDYWVFGGWAVDLYAGRVTRPHSDIDVAIWYEDLEQINALLTRADWVHRPEPGQDGYTGYERGSARLELAFLARDHTGVIYTPLAVGRGHWPPESFGRDRAQLGDVNARVVGLASLIEDKSGPRQDPEVAAKDRADVENLRLLHHNEQ